MLARCRTVGTSARRARRPWGERNFLVCGSRANLFRLKARRAAQTGGAKHAASSSVCLTGFELNGAS
eukprot:7842784-Pyramimonas_sp.AAC.1